MFQSCGALSIVPWYLHNILGNMWVNIPGKQNQYSKDLLRTGTCTW